MARGLQRYTVVTSIMFMQVVTAEVLYNARILILLLVYNLLLRYVCNSLSLVRFQFIMC